MGPYAVVQTSPGLHSGARMCEDRRLALTVVPDENSMFVASLGAATCTHPTRADAGRHAAACASSGAARAVNCAHV